MRPPWLLLRPPRGPLGGVMIEVTTKDGRPVKLTRKRGDTWVTIDFVSVNGRDVTWRVPGSAVAEFLEGLAIPIDDCTGAEARLEVALATARRAAAAAGYVEPVGFVEDMGMTGADGAAMAAAIESARRVF